MNSPIKRWYQPTKVGAILAKCDSSVHRDCGIRLICQLLLLALPLSVRRTLCRFRVAAWYLTNMLEATRISILAAAILVAVCEFCTV